jgi:hypothetical protein
MTRELIKPPDAESARVAVEMLRGWVIDGQPQYVLFPTAWNDDLPSRGRFLADTARHVANALSDVTGSRSDDILRIIVESFEKEINDPHNEHEGGFYNR